MSASGRIAEDGRPRRPAYDPHCVKAQKYNRVAILGGFTDVDGITSSPARINSFVPGGALIWVTFMASAIDRDTNLQQTRAFRIHWPQCLSVYAPDEAARQS